MANLTISRPSFGSGLERGIRLGMSIDAYNQSKEQRGLDNERRDMLDQRAGELHDARLGVYQREQEQYDYQRGTRDEDRAWDMDQRKIQGRLQKLRLENEGLAKTLTNNKLEMLLDERENQRTIREADAMLYWIDQTKGMAPQERLDFARQNPDAANQYGQAIERYLGEKVNRNAADARPRKVASLTPTEDGSGLMVGIEVTGEDGSTYHAPMTDKGGSEPDEKVKVLTPQEMFTDASIMKKLAIKLQQSKIMAGDNSVLAGQAEASKAARDHSYRLEEIMAQARAKSGAKGDGDLVTLKNGVRVKFGELEDRYKREFTVSGQFGEEALRPDAPSYEEYFNFLVAPEFRLSAGFGAGRDDTPLSNVEIDKAKSQLNTTGGEDRANDWIPFNEPSEDQVKARAYENRQDQGFGVRRSRDTEEAPDNVKPEGNSKQYSAEQLKDIQQQFIAAWDAGKDRGALVERLKEMGLTPESLGIKISGN